MVVGIGSRSPSPRPRAVRFVDEAAAAVTAATKTRVMTPSLNRSGPRRQPPPPPPQHPPMSKLSKTSIQTPPPTPPTIATQRYQVPSFSTSSSSTTRNSNVGAVSTKSTPHKNTSTSPGSSSSWKYTPVILPVTRKTGNGLDTATAAGEVKTMKKTTNNPTEVVVATTNTKHNPSDDATEPLADISALTNSPSPMKRSSSIPVSKTTSSLQPVLVLNNKENHSSTTTKKKVVFKTPSPAAGTFPHWKVQKSTPPPPPPPTPPPPVARAPPQAHETNNQRPVSNPPARKVVANPNRTRRSPSPPPPPPPAPPGRSSSLSANGRKTVAKTKATPPPPPPQQQEQQQTSSSTNPKAADAALSTSKRKVVRIQAPIPPPPPPPRASTDPKSGELMKNYHPKDKPSSSRTTVPKDKNPEINQQQHQQQSPDRQELAQSMTNISLISKGDDPTMDSLPLASTILDEDGEGVMSSPAEHKKLSVSSKVVVGGGRSSVDGKPISDSLVLHLSISQDEEEDDKTGQEQHSTSLLDGEFLLDTPNGSTLIESFHDGKTNGSKPGSTKVESTKRCPSSNHRGGENALNDSISSREVLSKNDKERLVQAFQKKLDTMKKEKEQLEVEFEKVQSQHNSTKLQLRLNQEEQLEKDRQTVTQFAEFQSRLTNSRLQVVGERTKRTQCEQELQMQNAKNVQLREDLQSTEEKLKYCQSQYSQLKVDLLKATRSHKIEPTTISPQGFVAALSDKVKTLAEANDRMSKIIDDAYKAIRARDSLERQLNGAARVRERLERENTTLLKECEELKKEVKDSQNYIDHLLQTSNETKQQDWEKREQQYQRAIHNLNQRILKQGTVVSFSVYKDEVEEGKRKSKALSKRVNELENEILQLQEEKEVMSRVLRSPITRNGASFKNTGKSILSPNPSTMKVQTPKTQTSSRPYSSPFSPLAPSNPRRQTANESKVLSERIPTPSTTGTSPSLQQAKPMTSTAVSKEQVPPVRVVTCGETQNGTSNWWDGKENKSDNRTTPGKIVAAKGKPLSQSKGKNSRRSPLQKVSQLGGRLALKKKLDNCRSPRQVQAIIHY